MRSISKLKINVKHDFQEWLEKNLYPEQIAKINDETSVEFAEINIEYLKKTIALLKKNDIDVILVNTPTPSKNISSATLNKFNEIKDENFSSLTYLDFTNFPLSLKNYADLGHLNHTGAKKFSLFFNRLLNNGLLNSKQKDLFVMNELEVLESSIE
jgi:hypothetical protein